LVVSIVIYGIKKQKLNIVFYVHLYQIGWVTNNLKREIIIGISFLFILVGLVGCTDEQTYHMESNELNLFNWEDYLGETTIEDFEQRYNITVNLFTFDDEEYMLSALESNPGKYDLIVTSDSIISELIKTKSLSEINKENIPNISEIGASPYNPFRFASSARPHKFGHAASSLQRIR